ncbi:unnamed protein product, partial [Closterium sp. Yama58-4]
MTLTDFIDCHVLRARVPRGSSSSRSRSSRGDQGKAGGSRSRTGLQQEKVEQVEEEDGDERIGYLAQHTLFEQIPILRADIDIPPYCWLSAPAPHSHSLGSNPPSHTSPQEATRTASMGDSKYMRVYSSTEDARLYPHKEKMLCNSSQVDLDAPDLTAFPLIPLAPFWDVLLSPGDLLYIPPRYWHYVKATRPSCSLSADILIQASTRSRRIGLEYPIVLVATCAEFTPLPPYHGARDASLSTPSIPSALTPRRDAGRARVPGEQPRGCRGRNVGHGGGEGGSSSVREQDRFLPIANISRIMKKALPQNAKIAKDAKETVQECVSEFISFITSEASDKCQREKRKTINGDDLLWAMSTLGFEDYVEPLKVYLHRYRETEGEGATKDGKPQPAPGGSAQQASLPSSLPNPTHRCHHHQHTHQGAQFPTCSR